jgi:hypothetical protein
MDAKMKIKKIGFKNLEKQKGMAVLETVPMIFIFVALLGFTIGFYGITQKMILHSIAARAYGFEQMRHRANVTYLRDVGAEGPTNSYQISQLRYFTVREPGAGTTFTAAKVGVDYRDRNPAGSANQDDHNTTAYTNIVRQRRNDRHYFDSVWVKVGHGICLRANCGE